jgi:hypothetical protein
MYIGTCRWRRHVMLNVPTHWILPQMMAVVMAHWFSGVHKTYGVFLKLLLYRVSDKNWHCLASFLWISAMNSPRNRYTSDECFLFIQKFKIKWRQNFKGLKIVIRLLSLHRWTNISAFSCTHRCTRVDCTQPKASL